MPVLVVRERMGGSMSEERFLTVMIEQTRYIEGVVCVTEVEDMTPAALVDTLLENGERFELGGNRVLWLKTEEEAVEGA